MSWFTPSCTTLPRLGHLQLLLLLLLLARNRVFHSDPVLFWIHHRHGRRILVSNWHHWFLCNLCIYSSDIWCRKAGLTLEQLHIVKIIIIIIIVSIIVYSLPSSRVAEIFGSCRLLFLLNVDFVSSYPLLWYSTGGNKTKEVV